MKSEGRNYGTVATGKGDVEEYNSDPRICLPIPSINRNILCSKGT